MPSRAVLRLMERDLGRLLDRIGKAPEKDRTALQEQYRADHAEWIAQGGHEYALRAMREDEGAP
jgi:hypothetical protein